MCDIPACVLHLETALVVLTFSIYTVAVGQVQTCSLTYLNHIHSVVLYRMCIPQVSLLMMNHTCSKQSNTHL